MAGTDTGNTHKHCQGKKPIGAEYVLRYNARLGIPLEELRPDLYGDKRPSLPPSPPTQEARP